VCEHPAPGAADLTIGLFGQDLRKQVLLIANTERGEELLEGAAPADSDSGETRRAALDEIVARRDKAREEMFASIEGEATGLDGLLEMLAPCINCHNCMTACPVCYCQQCFFDSDTFDLEASKYLRRASRKGAYRMPPDTILFHLGRLNHMASSCVACGACEDACPNDIPLLSLFKTVGYRVQEAFEYVPGMSLDEPLPLATFREEELEPR
jgi:formate dehydrogenase subunit beta